MYLQYCIYIYIHMCIHLHTYIYICIYTYLHTYIYTHVSHVHTMCCLICQPIGCFQQCQAPSIVPMSSIRGDTCGTRHQTVINGSNGKSIIHRWFSIWPSIWIYRGFPIATFDYQRVVQIVDHNGYGWYPVSPTVGSSTTIDADQHFGKNMTIVLIHQFAAMFLTILNS
jgi:hypothetical protein